MRRNGPFGPTGSNRIDLSAPELVRYWTGELDCDANELRDIVAAVGNVARDVQRQLTVRRAARGRGPSGFPRARTQAG